MRQRKLKWSYRIGALMAPLFLLAPLMAQAPSPEALKWFELALREPSDLKAIEAYRKAIERDPDFFEAYVNLSMRFKKIGDTGSAVEALQHALAVSRKRPIHADLRFKLLFELASLQRLQGNDKGYELAIAQAKSSTKNREFLATLAFEHGRYLYERERFQEALAELKSGLHFKPPDREMFENLIALAETGIRLKGLYQAAEAAERRSNLQEAVRTFEKIVAIDRKYRDSAQRLSALRARLAAQTRNKEVATLYSRAVKALQENDYQSAIALFEQVLERNPAFRDAGQLLALARTRQQQTAKRHSLQTRYREGMEALNRDDLAEAIVALEEVVAENPRYRKAAELLSQAREKIEARTRRTLLETYYSEGLTARETGRLQQALEAFEKIVEIDPGYRDVGKLLNEIRALQEQWLARTRAFAIDSAACDSILRVAAGAIEQQAWDEALALLDTVLVARPNDLNVLEMIARARAGKSMAATVSLDHPEKRWIFFTGGILLACLIMPIFALVFLTPLARMRYYLLFGDPSRAARVIEHALQREPERLQYYPVLAKIYLLTGRDDAQAIKIYRTIQQLNLPTPDREKIDSLLTNYYLVRAKETDSQAIDSLEAALQAELRRKQQR